MSSLKSVFVTGATGNQGGAVVKHLLKNGFYVKALVRDPDTKKAKSLLQDNLELVKGNLNLPETFRNYLQNCDAVFCNLHFTEGTDKEIKQGINLVSIAKENGIKHFVYSSVIGCDLGTGILHWESKFIIENSLRSSGIPFTILRPSSLMENLQLPAVKSRILKGKLVLPYKAKFVTQYISSDDIGMVTAIVLSNPAKYSGKTIELASEEMDGNQLAGLFSNAMKRNIKYQRLPMIIVRLAMGKRLAKMFSWLDKNDARFIKDINSVKAEFPGMISLEKWVKNNF